MNLQPTDTRHTAPQGVFRSTCTTLFIAAAFVATIAVPGAAHAQSRGARLSADLRERLASPDGGQVDVIVSGSAERVADIAQRHGLSVKRALTSGAVLSASPDALSSLAADEAVGAVSADATVHSQMAVTAETTGAAAAWSGLVPQLGRTSGRGVGVAIIDSGISSHPALSGKVVVNLDFTEEGTPTPARRATATATARTSRVSSRRAGSATGTRARPAAWRPARTC